MKNNGPARTTYPHLNVRHVEQKYHPTPGPIALYVRKIMTELETLTEQFIFDTLASGIIRDTDGNKLPNEYFPDIILMLMNEEIGQGRLTNGLIGYALAKGLDISEVGVMIPRSVSLAALALLRPYANDDRPDLLEVVDRCDRANYNYLTKQDIEESGATNVTQLH